MQLYDLCNLKVYQISNELSNDNAKYANCVRLDRTGMERVASKFESTPSPVRMEFIVNDSMHDEVSEIAINFMGILLYAIQIEMNTYA